MHNCFGLVSLIFGTTIPTNILMKCYTLYRNIDDLLTFRFQEEIPNMHVYPAELVKELLNQCVSFPIWKVF